MVSNEEKGSQREVLLTGGKEAEGIGTTASLAQPTTPINTSTTTTTGSSPNGGGNSAPVSPQSGRFPNQHQLPPQPSSFSVNKNEEFSFEVPAEAPVFVPTVEEFKNPLTYINKIRPIAEKYGICKIRPPSTWQPPFTVNVDKLRFTPRVQRLNELEAKTRVKLNFLDQIAKFWELQGSSLKIPMVERKALDLYSLHRMVQDEGGLEITTKERKWSSIAARLGYPQGKSCGTILKGHYERILFPYDVFTLSGDHVKQQKLEPDCDDHDYKPHGILSRQKVCPPKEKAARRSQRMEALESAAEEKKIKEELLDGFDAKTAELKRLKFYGAGPKMPGMRMKQEIGPMPKSRMNGGNTTPSKRNSSHRRMNLDPLAKYICHICNRGDVEEAMLLCDGCDDSYHTFCLMPPLSEIPKGEWRCPKCVVEEVSKPTEAFGFEQAQREYTLQQFGEMADQFKAEYFNIPVHLVPTEMVEREFWRIVSSIDEDVVVEYGADLHTMDHGSGFPTKSSLYLLPGDQEYAESSWNLNNLPLLEESILGHINADISGMKVPWMYVGMCFATFCWHNEDHWSYSINYLHWGEPKTWYGVPGNKAEAFENTMKKAAPELFQSQPDLLHQLVTIMNPNILMAAGVPVYRTDQHAGEFIITFPRAYHAGFNQGYNFAEAVNFAPADWMKIGRECINHYSTLRRFCVFSHDELVCKMALDPDKLNLGIATACYLDMAEMVDCEKKLRKSLLEWGVTKAERDSFELTADDLRQCEVCKTTCFLSAVTCSCQKSLVCLRHYSELCKCAPEKHTLKYRYTLDELPLMLRKLKVKAESFENWLSKVRDVIDPNTPTVINLEELQELAQEADDKKFPGSVLLERLNSAVLEAEKCVTVIQQLDINKMRTRTRNSCEFAKYKLTLEELDLFVQEIDNLCCIIPEGNSVRELQQMGKEFVEVSNALIKQDLIDIDEEEVSKLLDEGGSLCIELPQLKTLKYLYEQLHLFNDVRELRDSNDKIPLASIKKLLSQGDTIAPHSTIESELDSLRKIMQSVEEWEAAAKQCFALGSMHEIPEIEQLLEKAEDIEGNLPSQPSLKDALRKAKDWLATVEALQTNENYPYFHTLESVVIRGKNIPFQLEELKRMEDHLHSARQWKQRTSRTFLKKTTQFALIEALSPRPNAVMLPNSLTNVSHMTDEQFNAQFSEETGPVQIVIAFKDAEEKELREMKALRDLNSRKNPEIDRFCICRKRFYGNMYNCQLCHDWFHDGCVPIPKSTIRPRPANSTSPSNAVTVPTLTARERDRETKYLCPSCMRSRRPRLETILTLLVALQRLPIRLPEGEALQCLTERAMNWQDRARQALATTDVVGALATLSEISQKHLANSASTGTKSDAKKAGGAKGRPNRSSESSESSLEIDESVDSVIASSKNIEHAYSATQPGGSAASKATGAANDQALITLNSSTRDSLEELMMEGDLLEVSLDETQHLWRILNAAKPSISDLTHINLRYKIMPHPNEASLVNSRKNQQPSATHHDHEPSTQAAAARKSSKLNKSAPAATLDHNAGDSDPTVGSSSPATLLNTSGGCSASAQKIKRGRKLKIGGGAANANNQGTPPAGKDSAAAALAKKKRGRKSVPETNQTPTAASTSDEDEECSATNCVRPAGREVDWVQCDGGCNKWYHMYCVGLVKNQIKPDDDYVCRKCKKQSGALDSDAMDTSAAPALSSALPQQQQQLQVAVTSSKTKSRFEEDYPDDDDDGEDDEEDDDEDDDEDEVDDTATAPAPADAKVSTPVRTTPTPTTGSSTTSNMASNSLKTKANSDPPSGSSSSKKQKI